METGCDHALCALAGVPLAEINMLLKKMKRRFELGIGLACGLFLSLGELSAASGPGERFFQVQKAMIEKFDRNGDGRLDPAERETMRKAKGEGGARKGGGGRGGGGGGGGGGGRRERPRKGAATGDYRLNC